jgi:hypothetical protein
MYRQGKADNPHAKIVKGATTGASLSKMYQALTEEEKAELKIMGDNSNNYCSKSNISRKRGASWRMLQNSLALQV